MVSVGVRYFSPYIYRGEILRWPTQNLYPSAKSFQDATLHKNCICSVITGEVIGFQTSTTALFQRPFFADNNISWHFDSKLKLWEVKQVNKNNYQRENFRIRRKIIKVECHTCLILLIPILHTIRKGIERPSWWYQTPIWTAKVIGTEVQLKSLNLQRAYNKLSCSQLVHTLHS